MVTKRCDVKSHESGVAAGLTEDDLFVLAIGETRRIPVRASPAAQSG
jgi:hypothetical protein